MRTSSTMAEPNMATTPAEGHPLGVRFEDYGHLHDDGYPAPQML